MTESSREASTEAMGKYWSDIIADWESSSYRSGRSKRVIERLAMPLRNHIRDRARDALTILEPVLPKSSVAEIGCGSGEVLLRTLDLGAQRVIGIDAALGAINTARRRVTGLGSGVDDISFEQGLVGTTTVLPWKPDVLFGLGITEYVHKEDLREFLLNTKPTYVLLSFDEKVLTLQKVVHRGYRWLKRLPYYYRYTDQEFLDLLQTAGFDDLRVIRRGSNAFATNIFSPTISSPTNGR